MVDLLFTFFIALIAYQIGQYSGFRQAEKIFKRSEP